MNTSIINKIKEELSNALKPIEVEVCSVDYKEQNKNKFLTVELDKVGGMDLDSIVEATNIINPVIDNMDLPIEDYILDCISKER